MNRLALLVPVVAIGIANADDGAKPDGAKPDGAKPDGAKPDVDIDEVRRLIADGKFAEARDKLRVLYQVTPSPSLLFALGQVELKLENYPAAIDYYEQFLATNPPAEQVALAQQAIGAARARIAQPKLVVEREVPGPRVSYERDWDVLSTVIVAAGGAAMITGATLAIYGTRVGNRDTDSIAAFERNRDRAKDLQLTGAVVLGGGAIVAAIGLVRFAIRRVEVIAPGPSPGAVGVAWTGRW